MIEIQRHNEAASDYDDEPWDCIDCDTRLVEEPEGSNENVLYVRCPSCDNGVGLDTDKVHRIRRFRVVVQV